MALYIFSDAHLGAGSPKQELFKRENIAKLFELVKRDGDRLIILGDLFDYWFEYKHSIPKEHHHVLCMLSDLVGRGIQIDYINGNHDFWMGDFFEKHLGVRLHRDGFDTQYDGMKLCLTHGDGLAKADRGYRILKRIFRNRFNVWWYSKLPPDWTTSLAKKVSGASRKRSSKRDPYFTPDYEQYAANKLAEGYDVVAIGHLHLPIRKEYDNGVYVNSGDFIKHFSYVRIGDGSVELLNLLDNN